MTTLEAHDDRPLLTRSHEHAWVTESSHRTSEGLVRYVRCGRCGDRRVDIQVHPQLPPEPLSTVRPGSREQRGTMRFFPLSGR
ncbi:hypothetical protein [Myceligenerans pegani]|uniref:Uncharacterized protein n=1 Tax=Myceligenerans pegani TaxID=2776917 RepID=A0ABR9N3Z0_9MICO|nr:hypothetical protein [Myceligenerans sp. TRM 65318]MBE1878386.1 hypothetical protein [Myceligenerans sp. TRM 65318]MBE3020657.1 hypothetical protein [Myceligenerans sp. TRM 65318]